LEACQGIADRFGRDDIEVAEKWTSLTSEVGKYASAAVCKVRKSFRNANPKPNLAGVTCKYGKFSLSWKMKADTCGQALIKLPGGDGNAF